MTSKAFKIILGVAAVVGIALGLSTPLHPTKSTPLGWATGKLMQIGEACKLYADQHGGSYPSDSADLGNGWTNFVYMGGLTTNSPSNAVLAFVPPGRFPKDNRGLILFADLRVERVTPDQFIQKFNESQQALSASRQKP